MSKNDVHHYEAFICMIKSAGCLRHHDTSCSAKIHLISAKNMGDKTWHTCRMISSSYATTFSFCVARSASSARFSAESWSLQ